MESHTSLLTKYQPIFQRGIVSTYGTAPGGPSHNLDKVHIVGTKLRDLFELFPSPNLTANRNANISQQQLLPFPLSECNGLYSLSISIDSNEPFCLLGQNLKK